ncbi:DUF4349 domain-containing protein [Cellulomonas wangsupingiae]|uniref:DUF4349 domain-containing protein n=1 Tax=Cellulomonas wangsupingiae TaxID=2968085 RepID=A0ABY5K3J7_9CELL|nr:DUF4349 domain-containing protein [Cellulomonas wangsupingiae]MCC2335752.1 DUF4349 domain-containing protein [Cellulomonas wangsupingiae]UUI63986.1 DUF4349 domain-containing protein [Cellulomonas wangsupingiae]
MTRRTRTVLAGLLVIAALGACSAGSDESGITAEGAADSSAGDVVARAGSADGGTAAGADGAAAADAQQVVQTARATLLAPDPVAAAHDVVALVVRLDGRVDARYERSGTDGHDPGSATLTLRVPSAAMPTLSDDLAEIGQVREFAVETENVTTAAQDLDARITATELSVDRMGALLARAASSSEIIEAESALTERQANLERLRSERAGLADRVALSTVDVEIYAPERAPEPDPGPPTFLDGLATGWTGFVATVRTFLHVVGVLLPWLVVAGLAGAAVLVWRRRRAAVPLPPADGASGDPAARA